MADYTSEHTGVEIDLAVENANLMLLTGSEDPATSTVGTLGQIYQNTTDGALFRCTNIAGETYTWTEWADYSLAEKAKVTNATTNVGDLTYTEDNYVTDSEPLTESVDKLDMAVKDNADLISNLDTDKVETSAITNTLTETAAGKVLDARQGKALSDKIGTQTYTEDNYITDSEPLTESVDKLDMAVKDNADLISTNMDVSIPNLITNGNFESTSGWSAISGTITADSNELEYTITSLSDGARIERADLAGVVGKRYYVRGDIYPLYANTTRLRIGNGVTQVTPTPNQWNTISGVQTASDTSIFRFYHFTNTGYSVGDKIKFRKVLCVNLTDVFGSGNEPTKSGMDALVALVPSTWWNGTLSPTQLMICSMLLKMINDNALAIAAI